MLRVRGAANRSIELRTAITARWEKGAKLSANRLQDIHRECSQGSQDIGIIRAVVDIMTQRIVAVDQLF